jgi:hypothetical protein
VVQVHLESDLQLRAHSVNTADKYGIKVLLFVNGKEAAEAAYVAEDAFIEGAVRQVLNALLGSVGALDVNAGVGVGNGLVGCYLFCQVCRSVYRSGKFEKNNYFNIAVSKGRKTWKK